MVKSLKDSRRATNVWSPKGSSPTSSTRTKRGGAGGKPDKAIEWLEKLGPPIISIDDPNIQLLLPVLRPYVVEMETGWLFIKHPWVNTMSPFVNQCNEQYTAKFSMMREYLSKRERGAYLFVVVERPWRYETLARWWERDHLSVDELRDLLPEVWRDVEFPSRNLDNPLYLFEEAGFVTDDEEGWKQLPDPLTIYRGGAAEGISWTTDLEIGEWFSRRFTQRDEQELWRSRSRSTRHWPSSRAGANPKLSSSPLTTNRLGGSTMPVCKRCGKTQVTAEMRRSPKPDEWLCKDKAACNQRVTEQRAKKRKGK